MDGAADKIPLQQFKAALSADGIKAAVLRSRTQIALPRQSKSRHKKSPERRKGSRPLSRTDSQRDHWNNSRRCGCEESAERRKTVELVWTCGRTATSAETVNLSPVMNARLRVLWVVFSATCSWTLGLRYAWQMKNSCGPRRPSKTCAETRDSLETASGDELEVTNACVTEIILGGLVTVQHTVLWIRGLSHKILLGWDFMWYHRCTPEPTAGCLRMQQGNISFRKSHAVVPVRAESPQPERMAHS
ncbi:hypothetical protein T10_11187 [Trichinella papuae]|uniref:Uncharacterized protein n=1 Tax=Trichinella papuae TaxID=268474 RepID=A0A0V1M4M7_9BILA|nr:hypothetical protein T10_11187 [Trichinella papuae]